MSRISKTLAELRDDAYIIRLKLDEKAPALDADLLREILAALHKILESLEPIAKMVEQIREQEAK